MTTVLRINLLLVLLDQIIYQYFIGSERSQIYSNK